MDEGVLQVHVRKVAEVSGSVHIHFLPLPGSRLEEQLEPVRMWMELEGARGGLKKSCVLGSTQSVRFALLLPSKILVQAVADRLGVLL